jgi:hypothetical protein
MTSLNQCIPFLGGGEDRYRVQVAHPQAAINGVFLPSKKNKCSSSILSSLAILTSFLNGISGNHSMTRMCQTILSTVICYTEIYNYQYILVPATIALSTSGGGLFCILFLKKIFNHAKKTYPLLVGLCLDKKNNLAKNIGEILSSRPPVESHQQGLKLGHPTDTRSKQ